MTKMKRGIIMKLTWNNSDRDYIAKTKNFIFKLTYQDIGVMGYGKCYSLQVREIKSSSFEYLHKAFVTKDDGSIAIERYSVDKKLWVNLIDMLNRAESILEDNGFIFEQNGSKESDE